MEVSKPFTSTHPHPTISSESKFPSALFLNFAQAIASCLSAITYLIIGSWRDGTLRRKGLRGVLGIDQLVGFKQAEENKVDSKLNGNENGNGNGISHNGNGHTTNTTNINTDTKSSLRNTLPFLLLQVSVFQTIAGPIGFSALRHISYPTMVLGKVSLTPIPCSVESIHHEVIVYTSRRGGHRR